MNTKRDDPISKELREIEAQIDQFHKGNPLMRLPFGAAAWYYMAFCEDMAAMPLLRRDRQSTQEAAFSADTFIIGLKNPFHWLYSSCDGEGTPPCAYNGDYYQASKNLFDLSASYNPFEAAFTFASRGLGELSLEGSTIVSTHDFLSNTRYEVYDRLVKAEMVLPDIFPGEDLVDLVAPSVKVSGEKFSYQLNPQLVIRAIETLGPVLEARYFLPANWAFDGFSLEDFRRVANCLIAIAYLHFAARILAAEKGCVGLGYANSVFLSGKSDLERRLVRYSGCDSSTVSRLIQMMTYGDMGITRPDPAIQPIVKLNERTLALMPNLFISSSVERNFTILLNKLPSERGLYPRLVIEKEVLMREATKNELTISGIRYFNGRLSRELPDIDLALISDTEKACIILELKWFIAPAEVREVVEKSEEVEKGIFQLLKLSDALDSNPKLFFDALGVDADYDFLFTVVSDSFIGMLSIQRSKIPVVGHAHLLSKASSMNSIRKTMRWLSDREYLPIEGEHYELIEKVWNMGDWGVRWYGYHPLPMGTLR